MIKTIPAIINTNIKIKILFDDRLVQICKEEFSLHLIDNSPSLSNINSQVVKLMKMIINPSKIGISLAINLVYKYL